MMMSVVFAAEGKSLYPVSSLTVTGGERGRGEVVRAARELLARAVVRQDWPRLLALLHVCRARKSNLELVCRLRDDGALRASCQHRFERSGLIAMLQLKPVGVYVGARERESV